MKKKKSQVFSKAKLARRYQNQPWHVRLWRCRWDLMGPVWFLEIIAGWVMGSVPWSDERPFSLAWAFARAEVDMKKDHWFTSAEVDAHLRKKLDK